MEHPHVDLDHLRDLMKLMDQFSFDELEVREGAQRLHLPFQQRYQTDAVQRLVRQIATGNLTKRGE